MTSDQREKKPLSCGTAQNISHLRLRYPLGTWNTRVSRRFGRIRELPLMLASRLQGQDPPSLGWTYYDSLGPASDGPAPTSICYNHLFRSNFSCVQSSEYPQPVIKRLLYTSKGIPRRANIQQQIYVLLQLDYRYLPLHCLKCSRKSSAIFLADEEF